MTAPRNVPRGRPTRAVPAGWHPDPAGGHQVRYWDGFRWTEHVGDGGRAAVDPLPVVGPGVARTGGAPEQEAGQRPGCLTALLAGLAFAVTVAVIMVGAALVLGLGYYDDHPVWLRPVAFGLGLVAAGAVVDVRKRRVPRSGRQ